MPYYLYLNDLGLVLKKIVILSKTKKVYFIILANNK